MEHTIAAISTATGEAGIGIVRLSGETAHAVAASVFKGYRVSPAEQDRVLQYGHIVDGDTRIDEVLIAFMKAPKTYTREDMVEIYTHGGVLSVKKVLSLLLSRGARPAEPGEFTKRAFLNGRLDLTQAEAVIDLIKAKSSASYEAALGQLDGALSRVVAPLAEQLSDIMAYVEYSINFTEDDQDELDYTEVRRSTCDIRDALVELSRSANKGKILREGILTAIVGKPNVGKSSLLNALLGENRAIVTDIPGTTRDIIEEWIDLGGLCLRLQDTAGIRLTDDTVEKIGVARSRQTAEKADLILAVFDRSRALDQEDREILSLIEDKNVLILLNKNDLPAHTDFLSSNWVDRPVIETSFFDHDTVICVEKAILDLYEAGDITVDNSHLLANVRQEQACLKAIDALNQALSAWEADVPVDCVEVDLRAAYEALVEVTGQGCSVDVIDKVFSRFCVGK